MSLLSPSVLSPHCIQYDNANLQQLLITRTPNTNKILDKELAEYQVQTRTQNNWQSSKHEKDHNLWRLTISFEY